MADRGLRLPDAGFEVILRILKAYLAASRNQAGTPVKLADVVRRAGGGRTQVSGQNGFLASVGLIEGGNAKALTELGRRVALVADHEGQPQWDDAWQEVVNNSEDLTGIVDSVRVRNEMTTDDLLAHIVLTAGVAKNNRSLTGARTVIEVLWAGKAIVERDGTYRAASPSDQLPPTGTEDRPGGSPPRDPPAAAPSAGHGAPAVPTPAASGSPVSVHVHVWVAAADVDDELAQKLQAVIERLTPPTP